MKIGCESPEAEARRVVELPVLKNLGPAKNEIRESRVGRWRAASLIALYLVMIAHIIQWRLMGQTVSPIEPSESMYTLQNGAINAGFIFFSLAILATLIFGRFVCGWGCHIVALQDFCAWLMKKVGLTPRPFRSRLLAFVPLIVALYMFVWPTVSRYLVKPANEALFPQFTNHLITTDYWTTFPSVAVAIPFLFICGFMTVYFLGSKGFCTYGCPYGGFFSLADKVAPGKIRVTDACNECGHCTAVCTSNVLVHAEVKQYGMVVDQGCMKCMDCVNVCPTDALYFGFGKPAIGVKKTITKNYSLTWPEELAAAAVFALSFLAVWDVYQLVAMLMALGVAMVTTFLAVRTWKLIRSSDLSFHRWNLKAGGVIKKAGWGFLSFAVAWIGLNIHSGYVRYHERAGAMAFEKIRIPDELALARTNPARWLSPADVASIKDGKEHFDAAMRAGFFVNKEALSKLAWIEYLSGDNDQAVRSLTRAADYQDPQGKALSLYYRGAILNRLGRPEQALESLNAALAERPDLVTAREEKGEALWRTGRRDEAVATWKDAVRSSSLPLTNNLLAAAANASGQIEEAAAYQDQADRATPNDPLFHWMLGLRLQNVGMNELAEKHFERAIQLNPEFKRARN
ncbi:MAG TPA: tetratricopeptide repeat protein [Pyrinomonadaceae bacterium]|nr:tetratricopeptide repeat protein [Pyrinomonadaceae bacterium]